MPLAIRRSDAVRDFDYIHVSASVKGAFLLARCSDAEGVEIFASPGYPEAQVEEAADWLGYMLDGLAMASRFEWWSLRDELPDHVRAVLDVHARGYGGGSAP